jgi:hypothetical protein
MVRFVGEYKGMAERALFCEDWVREVVPGDASICALCSGDENICTGEGVGEGVGAFVGLIEEVEGVTIAGCVEEGVGNGIDSDGGGKGSGVFFIIFLSKSRLDNEWR